MKFGFLSILLHDLCWRLVFSKFCEILIF